MDKVTCHTFQNDGGPGFVVYAGEYRYPVAEGVVAIGVAEMAQILMEKSGE